MRIGIDARLVAYRRGMGNFIYNLIDELSHIETPHQLVLYVDQKDSIGLLPQANHMVPRFIGPHFYPLWEQIALPMLARADNLDLLHCPANTAPILPIPGTRLIITIHDVMYMLPRSQLPTSSSTYQRLGRLYRRWVVPKVLNKATAVISDSRHSEADLQKYLSFDTAHSHVIYGAHSKKFRRIQNDTLLQVTREKFGLDKHFVFALGATDPRKNTERIIRAYANFCTQATIPYQLVLAGLNSQAQQKFQSLINELGLNSCKLLGFISEQELVHLYNLADMVLYPSLYEGFGLPVLEAMACGAPVITSNTTSIPEIAGEAALLIDPSDENAILQSMIVLADDRTLQSTLSAAGLIQSAKFSWQRTAQETLELYERIGQK